MALVVAAVGIRFGLPAREQYAYYLAWGGLVCVLIYTLGQWREIAGAFSGRQARYGTLAGVSILVVLGILVAINYIGSKQNKRWDLTTNKQFSLSDQSRNVLAEARFADADSRLRPGAGIPALSRQAEGIRVRIEESLDRVHRSGQEADGGPPGGHPDLRHDRLRLQGPHRAHHLRHRAGSDQHRHQGRVGQAAQGLFHPGARRTRHGLVRTRGIQRDRARRSATRTTRSTRWSSRSRAPCPTMPRSWSRPDRRSISSRPRSTR